MTKIFFILFILMTGAVVNQNVNALELKELRAKLGKEISGWKWDGKDQLYDPQTIFDYINGAGEVYLAYNIKHCLSRRYQDQTGKTIILDIFDMVKPADAFGVFTHDLEGNFIELGQGARYRYGWLSLWQDRFFISVYAEEDTEDARSILKEIAGQVVKLIPNTGEKPSVVLYLPQPGLKKETIRFFHDHFLLSSHYYLSHDNILKLSSATNAALADYQINTDQAVLLSIEYPNMQLAEQAKIEFIRLYLPDADKAGAKQIENGKWCGIRKTKRGLAIVLESDSRALMEQLLKAAAEAPQ